MTLVEYAAIAEFIAAIAVVASLLYVARQIGQNTDQMRINASSERINRDFDITGMLAGSRELAEVWLKGGSELEGLDDVDKIRLMLFERRAITHWHNMFWLRQRHVLPDADWYELKWVIQNIGRREAIRESWKMFRDGFEAPFREFLDGQFSIADSEQ